MWKCKDCGTSVSRRSELLKHYKLEHRHYGRHHSYRCIYFNCPCTCKTWNALLSHLSRCHQQSSQTELTTFKCLLCSCNQRSNLKDYFQHIAQHLKNSERVICVFQGCSYKTSIYGLFRTHGSRNHKDIKDILELVVATFHMEDSICLFDLDIWTRRYSKKFSLIKEFGPKIITWSIIQG